MSGIRFKTCFTSCTFILFFLTFQVRALSSSAIKTANPQNQNLSIYAQIHQTLETGQVTLDEWARLTAYALFDRGKLPIEYRGKGIEKCGTWIFDKLFRYWDQLTPETREELHQFGFRTDGTLARPTGLDSVRSSAHFKIHYSVTSGDSNAVSTYDGNGDGTPDYIERIMETLEHVWGSEIDTMGYTAPPPDNTAGGDAKYDVYVYKLSPKLYGFVAAETLVHDNPNSPVNETNAATSYMALRNDYTGLGTSEITAIQVTVAHEFFHSTQNGYDVFEKAWFKEATATWMEDEIYDDINDNYQYLKSWFQSPWIPLDDDGSYYDGHWYGSWIFFRYVSEHIGGQGTIRRMWEKSIDHDSKSGDFSITVLDEALTEQGTTFKSAFQDFTIANLLLDLPPYDYEEADNYPKVGFNFYLYDNRTVQTILPRWAAYYMRVSKNLIPQGPDQITFTFTSLDTATTFSVQVVTRTGNQYEVHRFHPGSNSYTLNNTKQKGEIFIIVANIDKTGATNQFKLQSQANNELEQLYTTTDKVILDLKVSPYLVAWNENIDHTLHMITGNDYSAMDNVRKYSLAPSLEEYAIAMGYGMLGTDYILYGYSNGSLTQLINSQYSSTNNPPQFWIWFLDVDPACDSGFVWFSGSRYRDGVFQEEGFWRIKISDKSYTKIDNARLEYSDPLVVRGTRALWRNYDYATSTDNLWYYKNGSKKLIASHNASDNWYFLGMIHDFSDNLIVWGDYGIIQGTEKLLAYEIDPGITIEIDTTMYPNEIFSAVTRSNKIIWIRRNGEYDQVYLWEDFSTQLLHEQSIYSDVSLVTSLLRIDTTGVAWVESGPNFYGQPSTIFYYYDFSSKNIYTKTLTGDLNLELFTTSWGGTFGMRKGEFFFTAYNTVDFSLGVYRFTITAAPVIVDDHLDMLPTEYALEQNYPNPFNPTTTIRFTLPRREKVTLKIYDILGREVLELLNKELAAGHHEINFDASHLSSGLYLYRMKAGNFMKTRKMLLIK